MTTRVPLTSKLRSQRDEMKAATAAGRHIVYGYLRAKASGTAKAGTPYYVGIGKTYKRAFEVHNRGNNKYSFIHDVPRPGNEGLIRLLGTYKTREEAAKQEQALIQRYGRKHIEPNGVLLNRSLGGDTSGFGTRRTIQQCKTISEAKLRAAAANAGIEYEDYKLLSAKERKALATWRIKNPGLPASVWVDMNKCAGGARGAYSQRTLIAKAVELKVDVEQYLALDKKARGNFRGWRHKNPGKPPQLYFERLVAA